MTSRFFYWCCLLVLWCAPALASPLAVVDGQQQLWLATPQGLQVFASGQYQATPHTTYGMANGLPADTITGLAHVPGQGVWVGTTQGLVLFANNAFVKKGFADGLFENAVTCLYTDPGHNLYVCTGQRTYVYTGSVFKPIKILEGQAVRGAVVAGKNLLFLTNAGQQLVPGHWQVAVTVAWWWFLLIDVLLLAAFVVWYRRQKGKSYGVTYAQQQQQMLLAQMNPHFIFNSLNSVQKFILENNKELAQDYLAQFAQLMRGILEQSRRSTITVGEELATLRRYLDLERTRFSDAFDYSITVSEPDLEKAELPIMLLQPFVENAVWHGRMNTQNQGAIAINITQQGQTLVCTVTDNGIGISQAQEAGKEGGQAQNGQKRRSRASQIVHERIALLNSRRRQKITLTIADRKEANPTQTGTEVTLQIPLS